MYNTQYQYTHDIDWFFLDYIFPIHCASNGGLLPNNIYRAVDLQSLQVAVEALPQKFGYRLNINGIERYIRNHYENISEDYLLNHSMSKVLETIEFPPDIPVWMRAYSWSFIKMAQRGFLSFDRIEGSNDYFLVACPDNLAELTEDIQELIYKISEPTDWNYHHYYYPWDDLRCSFVSYIDRIERSKNDRNR